MLSEKYESPKMNGFVVIYTVFAMICVIVDYFKLAEYYIVRQNNIFDIELNDASLVYIVLASVALIGLLVPVVIIVLKKRRSLLSFIYFPQIDKIGWGVIGFFFFVTLLRLPIPDRSFDVVNYHLFLQNFGFENNLTYNYFPGNLQTFTFPLGDRLFFIFRLLFGYRGGVLLNTFVLILLFFQVKELLDQDKSLKIAPSHKSLLLSMFALFALSTEYILSNIGVYMIDLLMLPFLLELAKIAVGRKINPHFVVFYGGLMIGLSMSVKFTSVIFCALLFSVILLRYFRELAFRTIIISALILIFPLACYVTYNVTQTHNPVFPYFNEFFKSSLYSPISWPMNVVPASIYEALVWPISNILKPISAGELNVYSGRIGLGLLIAIAYLGIGLKRKISNYIILGSSFIVLIYAWVFTSGYARYGLFLEIILGILIVKFLYSLYSLGIEFLNLKVKALGILYKYRPNRRNYLQDRSNLIASIYGFDFKSFFINAILISTIVLAFIQSIFAYYFTITNQADWALRPSFLSNWNMYVQNLKMIGRDYIPVNYDGNDNLKEIVDDIDVWIVNPGEIIAGWEKLLKSDVPILNISWTKEPKGNQTQIALFDSLKTNIDLQSKSLYMLSAQSPEISAIELDKYGYKITAVHEIQPTFTYYPLKLIEMALK